ncbi:cerebellar degeneration-related protein 2 isoform X2 [Bombus pascuorum]|uniref:cerebellar degeneration-related protein 2 isoform X2 n=1 Tax=Bombus pascuorum TaxID=65598 RepID=UPI00298D92DA|nr:cerebellar degeneration-related protein 2 isoform X2 [Bombus pascuorum]
MSLLSSSIGNVRCLTDEEADHNMLQDLQLAAELGKTLLERNKELENIIKTHQSTVEEQAQEIEYMKKQTAALREVNDSRLKIYEQLEVSIQDLERANHRLVIENTSDKKLIKSQCLTIESLETRCEEFQKKIDEINEQHESILRQQTASQSTNTAQTQTFLWKAPAMQGGSIQQSAASRGQRPFQEAIIDSNVRQFHTTVSTNDEEVTELLRQVQEARSQRTREQKKVAELEQQLTTVLQENTTLEEQLNVLRGKAQDVKNLQEEINTLEEVRRGQLCGRCLRGMESKTHDELSIMLNQEEYDDIGMAESLISDTQRDTVSVTEDTNELEGQNDLKNPYRELVEKYQALLEVQRRSALRRKDSVPTPMSLQEELEMSGEFNNFHAPTLETEIQQEPTKPASGNATRAKTEVCGKKILSATPTDFSEAETSSSGFSDETSNKATQTEGRPGSFLCSIADGEDCKFSIYDDNSPFESRFRKTPEYRQLFSEIFSVLKRAAEAKDEGEKLPLLDDSTTTTASQQQSPIPLQEEVPSETTDDNQSVTSSMFSSAVSEPPYRVQLPASSNEVKEEQNTETSTIAQAKIRNDIIRDTNHTVSIALNYKKKATRKNTNRKLSYNERPATPDTIPTTNPRYVPPKSNSGGKKKFRPFTIANQNGSLVCNGYSYASKIKESPNYGRQSNNVYIQNQNDQQNSSFEYRNYKPSTASEDVARLKRLEMSYAEVLRLPNRSKTSNYRRS